MKRIGTAIVAAIAIAAVGLAGCASGGSPAGGSSTGGATQADAGPAFTIDFEALGVAVRNETALAGQYADFMIVLPEIAGVDFSTFSRVTIRANAFDADGNPVAPGDSMMMVTLVYDVAGDIRGPESGTGPNTPLKQFNVGGPSGSIHSERGSPVSLDRAPGGILFQNSNANVAFIEVTEVTFHNR